MRSSFQVQFLCPISHGTGTPFSLGKNGLGTLAFQPVPTLFQTYRAGHLAGHFHGKFDEHGRVQLGGFLIATLRFVSTALATDILMAILLTMLVAYWWSFVGFFLNPWLSAGAIVPVSVNDYFRIWHFGAGRAGTET